jgi:hypothetical protein
MLYIAPFHDFRKVSHGIPYIYISERQWSDAESQDVRKPETAGHATFIERFYDGLCILMLKRHMTSPA